MNNSNDNRNLHLEAVDEDQLVSSHTPNRVYSKRIDAIRIIRGDVAVFLDCERSIAGAEDVEIHAQKIIVDPPTVEGKETHHKDHISEIADHAQRCFLEILIV